MLALSGPPTLTRGVSASIPADIFVTSPRKISRLVFQEWNTGKLPLDVKLDFLAYPTDILKFHDEFMAMLPDSRVGDLPLLRLDDFYRAHEEFATSISQLEAFFDTAAKASREAYLSTSRINWPWLQLAGGEECGCALSSSEVNPVCAAPTNGSEEIDHVCELTSIAQASPFNEIHLAEASRLLIGGEVVSLRGYMVARGHFDKHGNGGGSRKPAHHNGQDDHNNNSSDDFGQIDMMMENGVVDSDAIMVAASSDDEWSQRSADMLMSYEEKVRTGKDMLTEYFVYGWMDDGEWYIKDDLPPPKPYRTDDGEEWYMEGVCRDVCESKRGR